MCVCVWVFKSSIVIFRYGLVTETQVSQTDVVSLESKWNVSVLRIRHSPQVQGGIPNPNETTLILNLVCDQVILLCKNITRFRFISYQIGEQKKMGTKTWRGRRIFFLIAQLLYILARIFEIINL